MDKYVEVEMCVRYHPRLKRRCAKGFHGSLRCHSKNLNCRDYRPSRGKR